MKKIIIFMFFILYSSICFSEIKGHIEIGKDLYCKVAYTELQIGYNFRFWNVILMPYGNQQTWYETTGNLVFGGAPFRDIYKVGSELRFDNITIDLSHFCSHKVISNNSEFIKKYAPPVDGNLTKISVRYDF